MLEAPKETKVGYFQPEGVKSGLPSVYRPKRPCQNWQAGGRGRRDLHDIVYFFKAQNLLTNCGFRPASAEDLPGVFCSETNQSGRLPSRFLRQMPEEKTLYYYGYRLNHTG